MSKKLIFLKSIIILVFIGWIGLITLHAAEIDPLDTIIDVVDGANQASLTPAKIEEYNYIAKSQSSNQHISKATHRFKFSRLGEISMAVTWEFIKDSVKGSDHSKLDKHYSTMSAHIVVEKEGSNYKVNRIGNFVEIEGKFHDHSISKSVVIDNSPFYTNPTIGLKGFILSEEKKSQFWLLRPDNLKLVKMKVERQGSAFIKVGKHRLEAIRVKWKPTGFKSIFFTEIYWFDKRSVIFVKNINPDGVVTEIDLNKHSGGTFVP